MILSVFYILNSSQLLADHCPALSLRDLLTLNVTSEMERKQQQRYDTTITEWKKQWLPR